MTTYRVIEVHHNTDGTISELTVKTDKGRKLKNKQTLQKATVLKWINEHGDVFYKIDLKTGMTGRVRKDRSNLITIGDKDLADNLD